MDLNSIIGIVAIVVAIILALLPQCKLIDLLQEKGKE
jgi:hypothetical protein